MNCSQCGKSFTKVNSQQKYCSRACARLQAKAHNNEQFTYETSGSNRRNNGAIAEHEAVSFYLRQGLDVFRSCGAHSAFDLVVFNRETAELKKIEVKTAHRNTKTGTLSIPDHNHREHDVLALWIPEDGKIVELLFSEVASVRDRAYSRDKLREEGSEA